MIRSMMKSKIHRATVTDANLNYVGSVTIDRDLLEASDIYPYEQVCIWNVTNGERFETYAIEGPRGAGDICLNGAAARKVAVGDVVIIATYAQMSDAEAIQHKPTVVLVDDANKIVSVSADEVAFTPSPKLRAVG